MSEALFKIPLHGRCDMYISMRILQMPHCSCTHRCPQPEVRTGVLPPSAHSPTPIILLPVLKGWNPGIIVYSVSNGSPASLSPQVIRGHYFLKAF